MRSKNWIKRVIYFQEKKEYNLYTILIFALFVGSVRSLEEMMLAHSIGYQESIINSITFYFLMIWSYTLVITLLTKVPWQKAIHAVLIGVFLGIFPPIIDVFIYGVGKFSYTYVMGTPSIAQLIMFDPDNGFPIGEGLILWSTIFFAGYYVYIKTSSLSKAFLGGSLAYLININAGSIIPAISSLIYDKLSLTRMACISLVQITVSVLFFLALNSHIARLLARRCLHCFPFVILTFLGAAVTERITPSTFLMAFLVFYAGITALVQNDYFDRKEDAISGRALVVERQDLSFFNATCAAMIMVLFSMKKGIIFLPLLLLFICSVIYNHDFYRAKRFFPGNYKIEGMWGLGAFLAGVLSHRNLEFTPEIILYCFLVFGGWSLVSTFKDYKDIDADRSVGNQTGYIMLMKAGMNLKQAHLVVSSVIVLCLIVPVIWLFYLKIPSFVAAGFAVVAISPFFFALNKPPSGVAVRNFLFATSFYLLLFLLVLIFYSPDTYIPTPR